MRNSAFCFDLDGTVTAQEILPRIARETDLFDEIALLTEATVKGTIPFDRSFRLRCRLLRDIPISTVRRIVTGVPLQEEVVRFIEHNRERSFIVTGNLDVWVEPLLARLGCGAFTSRAEAESDRLTGVREVLDKGAAVRTLRERFERVIAIGEGMNDAPMFEAADVRVAHGAVHPPCAAVMSLADYVTLEGGALCRLLTSLS
jgi:HAD superfamily phosphoserine phosphatase-like hydrolase